MSPIYTHIQLLDVDFFVAPTEGPVLSCFSVIKLLGILQITLKVLK